MAHSRIGRLGIVLMGMGVLAAPVVATAGEAGLAITRVNGQAVVDGAVPEPIQSDTLDVAGAISFGGPIADAGSSLAVALGSGVRLNGAINRGTAPYTVEWSVNGAPVTATATGSVELPPDVIVGGLNEVRMDVTDADGRSAADTVLIAASDPAEQILLEEEGSALIGIPDELLGLDGVIDQQGTELGFTVRPGASRLTASLDWGIAVNDFDLYLRGPAGTEIADGATGAKPEVVDRERPTTGAWTARIAPFLSVPDSYRLSVTAVAPSHDPLPLLDAGGPYEFAEGTEQALVATVTPGEAEVATVAWDLDRDGEFETAGGSVVAALAPGSHRIAVKATDAAGFEVIDIAEVIVQGGERSTAPAAVRPTPFYLRRAVCGGSEPQETRLSLAHNGQDTRGDAGECTNLAYPAAAAFSATGNPIGDDYPYEEAGTTFDLMAGMATGVIYFDAEGASPVTDVEVTVTGRVDGVPVVVGGQRRTAPVVDAGGVVGPRPVPFEFPITEEAAGSSVTDLSLRLDIHNAQGFIWVEMEAEHSRIELPIAAPTAVTTMTGATPASRVEVQVVAPDDEPDSTGWEAATSSDDPRADWAAVVDVSALPDGEHDLVARLVLGGSETASDRVRFTIGAARVSPGGEDRASGGDDAAPAPDEPGGGLLAVTGAGMLGLLGAALLGGGVVLRALDDRRHRRRAFRSLRPSVSSRPCEPA